MGPAPHLALVVHEKPVAEGVDLDEIARTASLRPDDPG
jgi:hypothetical protein